MENYIKEARAQGMSDQQIRWELLNSGWQVGDVDAALNGQATSTLTPSLVQPAGKLPGMAALIKEAFSIYKQRFGLVILLLLLPLILGGFNFLIVGQKSGALGVVGTILTIVTAVISWIAALSLMKLGDLNYVADFKQAFKFGTGKLLGALLVGILAGLAILGGTILLIIPGIIFFVWFSFSVYAYLHEGLGGTSALKRSKQLVKGYWWAVFGRLLGFSLLMFMPLLVVMGLMLGQFLLVLFASPELGTVVGVGIVNIILIILFSILFLFVIQPISIFYNYLIYKYLKAING